METRQRPRVLCVDDEPNVLEGLKRHLRRAWDVETSLSGAAGLEMLQQAGPFAVVTSDLRMPEMDGVAFLGRVREAAPDTVRVLLTGNADLSAAIEAVNEGNIFRFLTKPCPPEVLLKAVAAAGEQYRLVTAERILLEQTLRGSIGALTDVLGLANPMAFGRATRAKQTVARLAEHLELADRWQVEVAAMLSQVGAITLPPAAAEKLYLGQQLTTEEQKMVARLPTVAEQLLAHIPRLEEVRQIVRLQGKRYDGTGPPSDNICGDEIPLGARLLKVVLDFDTLESQGEDAALALDTLRGRKGSYDPAVLEALVAIVGGQTAGVTVREIALCDVQVGMVFAADVMAQSGMLLVARGQEVTVSLLERIQNFSPQLGVREPIRVILSAASDPTAPAEVSEAKHSAAGGTP